MSVVITVNGLWYMYLGILPLLITICLILVFVLRLIAKSTKCG